jgi:hypothetical protein
LPALAAGCSTFDPKRLAPPGFVRYERIADEKEPNPEIQARIADYKQENKPRFPKVGETAAGGARMTPIPDGGVDAEIAGLETARDELERSIKESRDAQDADDQALRDIGESGAALTERIAREKAAAEREKRLSEKEEASQDR